MIDSRRRWALGLLALGVGALVLLAGGLSGLQFGPGTALPVGAFLAMIFPSGGQPTSPEFLGFTRVLLALGFWVAAPILIIALVVSREFRRHFLRALPTYIIFAILAYLLLRFLRDMLRSSAESAVEGGQVAQPPPPTEGAALPSAPAFVTSPPQWLILLITLLIVAVIALLVWWLWPRSPGRAGPTALDLLADEAQSALDELRAGGDVRDAVLRCYAEMSRVLHEARGVRRGAGMTAREFEAQLRAVGIRDEHVGQLTRLFERVRYGGGASSSRDAREAEACLFALVQSYGKVIP